MTFLTKSLKLKGDMQAWARQLNSKPGAATINESCSHSPTDFLHGLKERWGEGGGGGGVPSNDQ